MNAREIVQLARIALRKSHPYLSTAIFSLSLRESEEISTMGVDKFWRLYYNPKFVESLKFEEVTAVLYHEILHLLRKHHKRAENLPYDFLAINIAEDAEINDDIRREGMKLPGECIYPETISCQENDIFENYLKNAEKYVNERQELQNSFTNLPFGGGSGSDGRIKPWEDKEPRDSTEGKLDEEAVLRKTASDIKAESAKNPGSVPGHLKDFADSIIPDNKIKPEKLLKRYLSQVTELSRFGEDSLTYARLHRKQGQYENVRIPAGVSGKLNVSVILDTSGSMTDVINQALGIVFNFAKSENLSVKVFSIDTEVRNIANGESLTKSKIKNIVVGGGGTILTPAIIEAQKLNPSVIVVITDGFVEWENQKPCKADVIIVKIDNGLDSPAWAKEVLWTES